MAQLIPGFALTQNKFINDSKYVKGIAEATIKPARRFLKETIQVPISQSKPLQSEFFTVLIARIMGSLRMPLFLHLPR